MYTSEFRPIVGKLLRIQTYNYTRFDKKLYIRTLRLELTKMLLTCTKMKFSYLRCLLSNKVSISLTSIIEVAVDTLTMNIFIRKNIGRGTTLS